jgi:hypothetical protein
MKDRRDLLDSIPGLGERTLAPLRAFCIPPDRFDNARQAAYARHAHFLQNPEQNFIVREQFRQRIQEETLPKTAWTGKEANRAFLDQLQGKGRFIDMVIIRFADLGESLDADGEFFARHGKLTDLDGDAGIIL